MGPTIALGNVTADFIFLTGCRLFEIGYRFIPIRFRTTTLRRYSFYHDLYTNKNNLIGSWIGREGTGIQAWSNYWFNARSSLQFGYRDAKVAPDFIPGGETIVDEWIKGNWWMRGVLNVSASVQHETWLAPVLASSRQTNWTSSVGISFQPHDLSVPLHLGLQ
jgi:hypothetical protein